MNWKLTWACQRCGRSHRSTLEFVEMTFDTIPCKSADRCRGSVTVLYKRRGRVKIFQSGKGVIHPPRCDALQPGTSREVRYVCGKPEGHSGNHRAEIGFNYDEEWINDQDGIDLEVS